MSDSPGGAEDTASQYRVIARRYRPQAFDDLVGQQHVARALSNAIATDRVGHAYLFTGARGIGKTSTARIFAKALNCVEGPSSTPDQQCDICRSIESGDDVDVLEIDGASNRGIEEIRQLRSNVQIRPSRARYKIYIIDEVHMLTTPAFNALLKTLEEPPEHVKFVFCTTDADKIPATVLSRCQRFDFSPVESAELVEHLNRIVQVEQRSLDPEALRFLGRRAAGSVRDSQSLLEQLLAFCDGDISLDDVHRMLGTADTSRLESVVEQLCEHNAAAALATVDSLVTAGVDAGQLAEQLVGYFRDLMTAAVGGSEELLLTVDTAGLDRLRALADRMGLPAVLSGLQILDRAVTNMRQSAYARTMLELALVQICRLEEMVPVTEVLAELRGEGGGSPQPAAPAADKPRRTAQKKTAEVNPKPQPTTVQATTQPPLTAESANQLWQQALATMEDMTSDLARYYDRLAISAPNRLVVSFRAKYTLQKESCERPERKAKIEDALSQAAGQPIRIELEILPDQQSSKTARAAVPSRRQRMREKQRDPLVREAIDLFDAEVVRIDEEPR